MRRIFTAVDISEEARRQAAEHIESLKMEFGRVRVGWERPEKLHLTLKFLGDTSDEQLEALRGSVRSIARETEPFELTVRGTGLFPNLREPRVLWLGVEDEKHCLTKIFQMIDFECSKIGFAPEKRKFKPHLTIARLKEPHASRTLAEDHLHTDLPPVSFRVEDLVIYESELKPTGSVYKVVERCGFKQN